MREISLLRRFPNDANAILYEALPFAEENVQKMLYLQKKPNKPDDMTIIRRRPKSNQNKQNQQSSPAGYPDQRDKINKLSTWLLCGHWSSQSLITVSFPALTRSSQVLSRHSPVRYCFDHPFLQCLLPHSWTHTVQQQSKPHSAHQRYPKEYTWLLLSLEYKQSKHCNSNKCSQVMHMTSSEGTALNGRSPRLALTAKQAQHPEHIFHASIWTQTWLAGSGQGSTVCGVEPTDFKCYSVLPVMRQVSGERRDSYANDCRRQHTLLEAAPFFQLHDQDRFPRTCFLGCLSHSLSPLSGCN